MLSMGYNLEFYLSEIRLDDHVVNSLAPVVHGLVSVQQPHIS
jgi:hypothetical protein